LTRELLEDIIRKAIKVVVTLIILLLLAYGISKSDFNKIKKYDEEDTSPATSLPLSQAKLNHAQQRRFSTKVTAQANGMISLGDFEVNIQNDKKLIINMSIKYKNHDSKGWLDSKDVKQEIIKKGVVLRSAVIDTLSYYDNVDINNKKMNKSLIENMNNHLSEGEVESIYFNKYLTH
jgi:flagellar basal body-associated protein FliL